MNDNLTEKYIKRETILTGLRKESNYPTGSGHIPIRNADENILRLITTEIN